uniref:Uncharacterized protein n=1 Tax=Picea sitchensis TaxID=3332 RepID=A9NKB9_PICSI|nr:unknown [Picea sitchensis]
MASCSVSFCSSTNETNYALVCFPSTHLPLSSFLAL